MPLNDVRRVKSWIV